jgi:hypothetical protein
MIERRERENEREREKGRRSDIEREGEIRERERGERDKERESIRERHESITLHKNYDARIMTCREKHYLVYYYTKVR